MGERVPEGGAAWSCGQGRAVRALLTQPVVSQAERVEGGHRPQGRH